MILNILRILFVIASAVIGSYAGASIDRSSDERGHLWGALIGGSAAAAVIGLEVVLTTRRASLIPTLVIGLFLGLLVGPQIAQPVLLIPGLAKASDIVTPFMTFLTAFLAAVVIYRTKDEFKFSIPYVEFRRQNAGGRPLILDTSVIIDGRIEGLAGTNLLDEEIVVPRFVLQELQAIADSADRLKRSRGRRGLDILQKLQDGKRLAIRIDESRIDGVDAVDGKLVALAKSLGGRLVTTDFNLNKIAHLDGVDVVNLNEIAAALKPAVLPGELLTLKIIKPGAEQGQGVGYLDDGTMVVVEGARGEIGKEVTLMVTSSLQTHAGKMIFGRMGQS